MLDKAQETIVKAALLSLTEIEDEGVPEAIYVALHNLASTFFGENGARVMTQFVDATDGGFYVESDNIDDYIVAINELKPA